MTTEFIPDAARLSHIFSTAAAPTFFLGAVAGFASLMTARFNIVLDRVRLLNAIEDHDQRAHLKMDIDRLMRRAQLLRGGILAVLSAGVCATVLLAILFLTEFIGLKYAYGAGAVFVLATSLLGYGLFRFAQEAHISLNDADKY
jgi:hypothetical protein